MIVTPYSSCDSCLWHCRQHAYMGRVGRAESGFIPDTWRSRPDPVPPRDHPSGLDHPLSPSHCLCDSIFASKSRIQTDRVLSDCIAGSILSWQESSASHFSGSLVFQGHTGRLTGKHTAEVGEPKPHDLPRCLKQAESRIANYVKP